MADPNPLAGMPFTESLASNMNESLQWMSRMWGTSGASPVAPGLPSMLMPTLDPKELEKRIGDLKTVEHWLDMNRALLHTTIQTLEMQRNAMLALQSMAQTPPAGAARSGSAPEAAAGAQALPFNPAQWWNALQDQFARVAAAASEVQRAPEEPPAPDAAPVSKPAGT